VAVCRQEHVVQGGGEEAGGVGSTGEWEWGEWEHMLQGGARGRQWWEGVVCMHRSVEAWGCGGGASRRGRGMWRGLVSKAGSGSIEDRI